MYERVACTSAVLVGMESSTDRMSHDHLGYFCGAGWREQFWLQKNLYNKEKLQSFTKNLPEKSVLPDLRGGRVADPLSQPLVHLH